MYDPLLSVSACDGKNVFKFCVVIFQNSDHNIYFSAACEDSKIRMARPQVR
jgi:hypothetical protein